MDDFLIYVVIVSIFALIWIYYGLIHNGAPRRGLALIGYGAVAVSVVLTVIFAGVAFYR